MPEPQFIVCERSNRWIIPWRRALRASVLIGQCSSIAQVDELLGDRLHLPIAVDAVALMGGHLLSAIARWSDRGSPVIVLASPSMVAQEFTFREAGAMHLVFSPRQVAPAARLLRRHLLQLGSQQPVDQPLEKAVFDRLPWARHARRHA